MKDRSVVRVFECKVGSGASHLLVFGHIPTHDEMTSLRRHYLEVFALSEYAEVCVIGSPCHVTSLAEGLSQLRMSRDR